MLKTEKLKLVSEWDKTFPQSEKVQTVDKALLFQGFAIVGTAFLI